jgi:hypothetical protein
MPSALRVAGRTIRSPRPVWAVSSIEGSNPFLCGGRIHEFALDVIEGIRCVTPVQ